MQFQGLGIIKIKRSSHNEIRYDYSHGTGNKTRTCTVAHWNLNPTCLPIPPYPHLFINLPYCLLRCPTSSSAFKSLPHLSTAATRSGRLTPPPAALPSLPNSTTSAYMKFLQRHYFITGKFPCQRRIVSVFSAFFLDIGVGYG